MAQSQLVESGAGLSTETSYVVEKSGGGESIDTTVTGLYRQRVVVTFDVGVTIDSDDLDVEFTIPFDNDTEANEAEIKFYNLSYNTTNQFKSGGGVTVKAGYGDDIGVIFSGKISHKKITDENPDRVITITAVDGLGLTENEVEISYAEGNTAQAILYDLVSRLGFPIATFSPVRDYTYDRAVTVDGSLMDAIGQYAGVCGVSAYICKGSVYVQPLSYSAGDSYALSKDTGFLTAEEYEKEVTNEGYTDTERGWQIEMLLNHRIQTGTRIDLTSNRANGTYYVKEGKHTFDGTNMLTDVTAVEE